jgi:NADH dehydrogenase
VADAATLDAIPAGIDRVVHCAALMLPNDGERIRRVNVEGTRNVIRLAQERAARRFIYFSAVSAVYRTRNVYGESKAAAEALVAASGLDYTILRPTMVYGRDGGLHFQQLVRLLRRVPGALPVLGSGQARLQPVWVDDVVRAVELVLEQPRAIGRAYGVAGATVVTFDQYVDRISAALHRRPPLKLHVPLAVCTAAAYVVERLIGPSFLSPAALRGLNEDATLDTRPFTAECGYAPVDLDSGLRSALG